MRYLPLLGILLSGAAGCASSADLARQADERMVAANAAASAGNMTLARTEQRKAEHLYQRAANRAYEQELPPPPPPPTPPPLPVFDPQLER